LTLEGAYTLRDLELAMWVIPTRQKLLLTLFHQDSELLPTQSKEANSV
jgi:hypothetical protein